MSAAGLQTHIWENNTKSIILLGLYPVLLGAIVWACTVAVGYGMQGTAPISEAHGEAFNFANHVILSYWPLILAGVVIWFLIAWFFHGKMVRALSHSRPVTREEEPELYNLLENLCITAGMNMPRLEIIETHARNAFASGIDEKSFSVTVTRGLMQSLTRDELEAVLAHELTHILNRDVRLLIVTVIFTGMIGFAAQLAWSNVRYMLWVPRRRSSSDKGGNGAMIILFTIIAILWLGYLATLLTRFALSRRREYMADAGAVQLTKKPEAMMAALMRIAGMDKVPAMPGDIQMMCIENTVPFLGMFATHPPIEKRIQVLSETTNTPVPDIKLKIRAHSEERFQHPSHEGREAWLPKTRFNRTKKNPWA